MEKSIYPEGYHALNPILRVDDTAKALEFYEKAFGAEEDFRREAKGRLLLAVIKIGDSRVMLFDKQNEPEHATGGDPRGNGVMLKLYVENVDDTFEQATSLGAREESGVKDQYFGERSGILTDPFGFSWQIAQFKEQLPHEVIEQRMQDALGG